MLTAKRARTLDDFRKLPAETRAELLEGEIFMSPSPDAWHQRIVGNSHKGISAHIDAIGAGDIYVAPLDVELGDEAVQPDLLFIAAARRSIVRDRVYGAPDLVIEVLSESTAVRDRLAKRRLYARHGVREYWIIDPESRTVEVLRLTGRRYGPAAVFGIGDVIASGVLPGLRLTVRAVFAGV